MSLSREIYWLLRKTGNSLKRELRKKIEEHGITWPQFHALYHIGQEGIAANELARELQCNASNMTGLIDRMTENGWVYREHSATDRRIWLIKPTQEGLRLIDTVRPQHRQNIEQRMQVLSPQELQTLHDLLTKLLEGSEENKA